MAFASSSIQTKQLNVERRKRSRREALLLKAIVRTLPKQGEWKIQDFDYFASKVVDSAPLEFSHGRVVEKAMPFTLHVLIAAYLRDMLNDFVRAKQLGRVFSEGAELRHADVIVRIPDIVFISTEHFAKRTDKGFPAIDLAIEVLSASNWKEDVVEKRRDYALSGVPEYWIVDPKLEEVTVLKLEKDAYTTLGVFKSGQKAMSSVLSGFEVDVSAVFEAGR